jgi:mercuric ion transport protein
MKQRISLPNLGILTAFASSLCCIMPVLAIVAGTSGLASTFSWLEPARPYFIGVSVLVLGFAWYQKLKPQPIDACGCAVEQKVPFMQTKSFLSIITVVSALLLSFPSYAYIFFPKNEKTVVVNLQTAVKKVEFSISGMTCTGCEEHVKAEVNKLNGIVETQVSYEKEKAFVTFDEGQTSIEAIKNAINSTGYEATNHKIQ